MVPFLFALFHDENNHALFLNIRIINQAYESEVYSL